MTRQSDQATNLDSNKSWIEREPALFANLVYHLSANREVSHFIR